MADNVNIPVPSDSPVPVATDDVGGAHYQKMKIALGVDGAVDTILDSGQQAMVNSVPVVLASDQSAIPISSGTLATQATLAVISADISNINGAFNGSSVVVQGVVTANLGAGTNNIGDVDVLTLPAIPAGANTIGSVKLTDGTLTASIRDTGTSDSVNVAIVDAAGNQITTFGGGTEYTEGNTDATITGSAMLMEGAADTLLPVQGTVADGLLVNLGTNNDVTVTGSVTANAGTNLNTSLLALEAGGNLAAIKTAAELLDDAVYTDGAGTVVKGLAILGQDGTNPQAIKTDATGELQVDVLTLPALPAGANNIGDVDVLTLPALPTGTNTIGSVKVTDGTLTATVRDTGTSDSLNVAIVDASGNQITSFGGGTQYDEDTLHSTGDKVTMAGVVQQSADAALAGDGDRAVLQVDGSGFLKVNIKAGAGSGGTAMTDDAAFTVATTSFTPVGGTYKSVRDAVDDNDAGAFAMTSKRGLLTVVETPNGDSAMDDTNDAVRVNIVAGSSAGTEYTEGATDASITGTAMMMEGATDTLLPVQGTVADGLLVNLGTNNDVTVTGSVTANAGTNLNTSALALEATASAIKTAVEILDNTVAGTEMQVDVLTMPSITGTVTANAGTNLNTSTLALETGGNLAAAKTAVEVIDDAYVAQGTALGTTKNVMVGGSVTTSAPTYITGQINPLSLQTDGSQRVAVTNTVTVGSHAVTNAGTFAVQESGAALTALQLIDDTVYTDGTGTVSKGIAVFGQDGTNPQAIKTDATGELQVDVLTLPAIPAGTNNIGDVDVLTLPALPAGTNNIGDVDVLTLPALPAGTNNIGDVDVLTLPALPTGTNTIGSVKVTDGTLTATVRDTGTSDSLNVAIVDGSGNQITSFGGGTQYTEDDPAAANPIGTVPMLVRADSLTSTTVTLDGDNIAWRGNAQGAAWVQLSAANNQIGGDPTNGLDVDVTRVTGTVTVGGTAADGAAVSGNPVRIGGKDGSGNTQDIATDTSGELQVDILTLPASTNTIEVVGDAAHGATAAGNPLRLGATAETSPKGITPVTDGQASALYSDSDGMLMVKLHTSGADLISEAVSDTGGTSTAFTNFSAVASTYNYVTNITAFRTDAGTTMAYIDFRDGTAGSVKYRVPLPPTGGSTINSAVPLFKTSANTALAYDVSAALTTVYISVTGFQSKV